jgi:hypothetical protein
LREVVREVVYKYLDCGDLRSGFARIKCKECQDEVLLAFSCKGRYFCTSCHQKRVLMFGEWITEGILYIGVRIAKLKRYSLRKRFISVGIGLEFSFEPRKIEND